MTINYEDQSAQQTRAAFLSLPEAQGWHYHISWRWNRRSRDGVVKIEDDEGGLVAETGYCRNTHTWGAADRTLCRLRTGSAKHQALLALLTRLQPLAQREAMVSGRSPSDREHTTACVAHGRCGVHAKATDIAEHQASPCVVMRADGQH